MYIYQAISNVWLEIPMMHKADQSQNHVSSKFDWYYSFINISIEEWAPHRSSCSFINIIHNNSSET